MRFANSKLDHSPFCSLCTHQRTCEFRGIAIRGYSAIGEHPLKKKHTVAEGNRRTAKFRLVECIQCFEEAAMRDT
jgi:uncharacterized Fe-S cluster-containing protein